MANISNIIENRKMEAKYNLSQARKRARQVTYLSHNTLEDTQS